MKLKLITGIMFLILVTSFYFGALDGGNFNGHNSNIPPSHLLFTVCIFMILIIEIISSIHLFNKYLRRHNNKQSETRPISEPVHTNSKAA